MRIAPSPSDRSVPNSNSHILNFVQFLQVNQLPGVQLEWDETSRNLKFVDCSFIPFDALKSYFDDRENLNLLLRGIYGQEEPVVDEDTIYSSCLILFSILVAIGRGDLIEHCYDNGILDARLPLKTLPAELETISKYDSGFWPAFNKEQWRFCPHHFELNNISITYPDLLIFPIASRETIDVSDGRVITKIRIHSDYHNLRPRSMLDPDLGEDELNTFVLKSLDRTDINNFKCYDSEVKAFRKLGSNGLANARRAPPNEIIRFFGSFKQTQLYHIILEYADLGTLQDYLEKTPPPRNHQEVTDLWKSIAAIAKGVSRISQVLSKHENTSIGCFHGYHQDLKLSNILAFSEDPKNMYKVKFKIADMGLSNFVQGQCSLNSISGRGRPGTRTYGSPESHQARHSSNGRYDDGQASDVWSLACIFSVVAMWVVGGWRLVEGYAHARRQERIASHLHDSDCFHNDNTVLNAVREWHTFLTNDKAPYDHITPELWDRLLQPAFDCIPHRSTAIQFQIAANDIFNLKQNRVASRSSSMYAESTKLYGMEVDHNQSPVSHSKATSYGRRERPMRETSIESLDQVEIFRSNSMPFSPFVSQEPEDIRGLPSPVSAPFFPTSSSILALGNNTESSTTNTNSHFLSSGTSSGLRTQTTAHSSQRDSSSHQLPFRRLKGHDCDNEHQSPSAIAEGKKTILNHWNHNDCRYHSDQARKMDSMSIADLAAWKEAQDRNEVYEVPHAALAQNLEQRDYVFLLEDSESMKSHWNDVCKLFPLMAKFIEKRDKDGVELYFTNNTDHYREKDTWVLAKRVKDMKGNLNASSEPAFALERIWESHAPAIRRGKRVKFWTRKKRFGLTICVFTDGVWRTGAGERVENLIQTIITFLQEDRRTSTDARVGIQFIQFGNGELETRQLEKLDKGLKEKFGRDIVDVEPFTGNVWKMFLGTILPSFDDDYEDECTCRDPNGHIRS